MPALEQARKQAMRVSCLSNQKQLYQAAVFYAMNYDDSLPIAGNRGTMMYSRIYGTPQGHSFRVFLAEYASVSMDTRDRHNRGLYLNTKDLIFCPAQPKYPKASDWDWGHQASYGTWGFGLFNAEIFGSTRLTDVSRYGPLGPKLMFMDFTSNVTHNNPKWKAIGNNHNWEGANVISCDGSGTWYDYSELYPIGWHAMVPAYDHYLQHPSYTDGTVPTLYYPTSSGPAVRGQHHMDQYWRPNRRLYGYKSSAPLYR
jgi:hypothetical protein